MLTIIIRVFILIGLVFAFIWMRALRSKVLDGQTNQETLSRSEQIIIWFLCFLDPVFAGAIFYYGWRKKLPVKAKKANSISLWAFLIELLLVVGLAFIK